MMRLGLVCLVGLLPAAAFGADPSAEQIAQLALDNNMFSTANARATLDLEIVKDGAVVRTRRISTLSKRADGLVKTFVEFESPADVAGTKFLSLEEKGGETAQYIYLPAFKKVKRVVGAQRTQSFMGTDFSYADLEGRDVNQSTWKKLPDEKVQGEDCWVVEATPKDPEKVEYGKYVLWVHKKLNMPVKSDLYDKTGKEVVKRLVVNKIAKKDDRHVAMDTTMETVKKGTQTRLKIVAIDLKSSVPDEALTREALEH